MFEGLRFLHQDKNGYLSRSAERRLKGETNQKLFGIKLRCNLCKTKQCIATYTFIETKKNVAKQNYRKQIQFSFLFHKNRPEN